MQIPTQIMYAGEMTRQPKGREDRVLWGFHQRLIVAKLKKPRSKAFFKLSISISDSEEALYWGWWNLETKQLQMIYYKKFMVEMCFPYGTKICELKNRGKLVPLAVEILERAE